VDGAGHVGHDDPGPEAERQAGDGPVNWLLHVMGVDNVSGRWYGFWSGFGGDVAILASILAAPILLYRKHNCGIRWCWRIARHDFTDPDGGITHHLCRTHHPAHPGKPVTASHIQAQYHLYLGKKPGRG
jgi:hypothetical protein